MMSDLPKSNKRPLALAKVPKEHRAQFEKARLGSNVGRMYAFSIYIIILQLALNVINILRPSSGKGGNIMIYVSLSMSALLTGVVYCVLFRLVRKGAIKNRKVQAFLVQSLLYLYLAIQLTFCTLNIITTGGVNSYIIAIMIIGMFPILPPLQSGLTILSSFLYMGVVLYFTRSISDAWSSILLTDVWANLIIITGLTVSISFYAYSMYVSNFLKSLELQHANQDLEETVLQRTHALEEQTKAAQVASQAKGEFLARMSHEIRTPLNAIMGMTQIAKHSTSRQKIAQSLDEISKASDHLLGLINDVLDMSKIESGKFVLVQEPFALRPAMEEVAKIIAPRCEEKNIHLTVCLESLPPVGARGDKLRLKQVLINLLGNAVKFTPEGGQVYFSASAQEGDPLTLHCMVRDTGIGMSQEQIRSLFLPFEQADDSIAIRFGGTGLGLTISQNLIGKMGGAIGVESELGKGSAFSFSIPLTKADLPAPQMFGTHPMPVLTGRRILLAEDIEINRVIVTELLADTRLEIDEATDGMEAVERFAASPPGYYDLIFMDVQMPRLDGYDATRKIRGMARPDAATVPIIAMTASAYREDVQQALESGMNGHLAKPIDIQAVLHVLAEQIAI